MPDTVQLSVFFFASLLLAISPGPDLLYVITRGAAQGWRAGLMAAVGLCVGIVGHTLFCMIGISALVAASPTAFAVLKLAGAAYLVYLGVQMLRRGEIDGSDGGAQGGVLSAIFRQSILMNLINPKVAMFFLAFLPQFVDPDAGPAMPQIAVLGALFLVAGFLVMGAAGVTAGYFRDAFIGNAKTRRVFRFTAGAVLIGLGLRLALADH